MITVPVLFTLPRSEYSRLEGVDCYDEKRNAFNYSLGLKVIAHPPCRFWSRMHGLAKPRKKEYECALWAFDLVNELGGILEHPIHSNLWNYVGVKPYPIDLGWYGHPMKKTTGLYFNQVEIPRFELGFRNDYKWLNKCSKRQAMYTPLEVCKKLVNSVRKSYAL